MPVRFFDKIKDMVKQNYGRKLGEYLGQTNFYKKKIRILTYARGSSFLAFAASVFFYPNWYLLAVGFAFFLAFLFFIVRSAKLRERLIESRILTDINEKELKCLDYRFSDFYSGNEFIRTVHDFSYDIDIFGKFSIFQLLNRTVSLSGKLNLAASLLKTKNRADYIRGRQEAVKELKELFDFRQKFLMIGIKSAGAKYYDETYTEKSDTIKAAFLSWVNKNDRHFSKTFRAAILIASPLVLTLLSGFVVFGVLSYKVIIVYALLQVGFVLANSKAIARKHAELDLLRKKTGMYAKLLALAEKQNFKSPYLLAMKKSISEKGKSASEQMQNMQKLLNGLEMRYNILVGFFLNAFLLWDLQVLNRLEKFRIEIKDKAAAYFDFIGELDELISLSTYAYNFPDFSFPEITESDDFILEMKQAGHPLIAADSRVDNDFSLRGFPKAGIITGANMAGKSTFLRTVAVNMVLAAAGAPVCARQMSYQPIKLITGIRNQDSLEDNASYFYAELLRLKKITDALKTGEELFIIIDEMLRGTNSDDKHKGSYKFIEQIINYKAAALLATHDTQLAVLEDKYPNKVFNMSFESEIEDNRLRFDYLIRKGVSKNLNASFLMKKYGITDE